MADRHDITDEELLGLARDPDTTVEFAGEQLVLFKQKGVTMVRVSNRFISVLCTATRAAAFGLKPD